ncbi:MAG: multiheme c-type cytochrome [Chryseosolibacter sp.]
MSFPGQNIRTNHLVIAGHFLALILIVATCGRIRNEDSFSGIVHPSGREFAGSETCIDCHQSIAEAHLHTPHFLTSRRAAIETVKGSFDAAKNVFVLNERLNVIMEKTDTGLFQRGVVDGVEVGRKPFDITIGSGRQGQTYLYWQDDALFQLPVSYYAPSDTWSNSPGYPPGRIVFDRNIPARCMECHSTYLKIGKTIAGRETFDNSQMMLGVDCERCHGPAAQHVTFHRTHPDEKEARHVTNPAKLNRQQKLDNCALCHSGIRDNLMPSFSFMVGDRLDDFSFPASGADSAATLDVHGNQYGLLTSSKCFRMSAMDCSSCHDVHVKETNNLRLFSARCMNCHEKGGDRFCKQPDVPGLVLDNNCIDCHMPALPSRQVFVQASDDRQPTPFFVRTHLVGTYEAQIRSFLEKIDKDNSRLK